MLLNHFPFGKSDKDANDDYNDDDGVGVESVLSR
jgi:hypothetical protein